MEHFTNDGYRFELTEAGPASGPAAILLHGFPADRQSWQGVAGPLAAGGYRTLAPDLRGYSPGAQPRRRREYALSRLRGDVVALADQAGAERFHLIGHDWGAVLTWSLAARHPERVLSVSALSVPHPGAFRWAMGHSSQLLHSWYMGFFQLPGLPERSLSARHGALFQRSLERTGLNPETAARYAARAASPAGMRGPLGWYRGLPFEARQGFAPVSVPTLLAWGDGDRFVSQAAVARCDRFVTGPYRFEPMAGKNHWLPEEAADEVADLVLGHLANVT